MSKIKVGINGFGRIGRLVFRAGLDNENIEFVGINDMITPDYMEYMLKYDTIHGSFKGEVSHTENSIIVNGKSIPVFSEKDPSKLPWGSVGAERRSSAAAQVNPGIYDGIVQQGFTYGARIDPAQTTPQVGHYVDNIVLDIEF